MANYGFKVSQGGYAVKSASAVQLIFSSAYDTFKVFTSGSGTLSVAAAVDVWTPRQGSVTIAHNLGYIPAYFCFCDNPVWGTAGQLSPYTYRITGVTYNQASFAVDTSNLYIYFYNPDSVNARTFEYRYYIFYNDFV